MLKNSKFFINTKFIKKIFNLIIALLIIYFLFTIFNNYPLILTVSGEPPTYGNPSPVNNSADQPLSFSWSIPINDPEGDLFSWSIESSNGQIANATGDSNDTMSLSLFGLAYMTTYTVWVNATDIYDNSSSAWYYFTTKANNPPVFGTPSPANGSTNQSLSFSWSIPINDPEGDLFSWTIQCSNGQSNSGSNAINGTKSLVLSGLAYSKTYIVWVNATDPGGSGQYTRAWYTFTTKASLPPVFGTPSPANGSTDQSLSFSWSIPINDPEGDLFSWTIQCSNGQSNSGSNVNNGTKSLVLSGLAYSTIYTVWVNATDGYNTAQVWFSFTTRDAPGAPTDFIATDVSRDQINLSWTMGSNCDRTYIEWNYSPGWSLGGGNVLYNDTGTSYSHSGLVPHTTYYYQAWGWNETYELHSSNYAADNDTTWDYTPSFDMPSPVNGSTFYGLSLTWSINIFDRDGDTFNWSIKCSNGQIANATSASNGTKSLSINGLNYNIWYTVWVNATNDFGTSHAWFRFYTKTYSGGGGGDGGGGGPPPADYPPTISSISRMPTKVTSENNVTISATVTDDIDLYSVYLYWNDGSQHSKEMIFIGENKYSVEIGPFKELITVTYWINATDNAFQSTESISYSLKVADETGPSITVIKPISGSTIYDTTPTIKASYNDPSNINIKKVILTIDRSNVIPQSITESSVTYTPTIEMTYSTHSVKLNVSDVLGNSQIKEWSFTIKKTDFINEEDIENLSSGEEKEIKLNNSNETSIDSINFKVAINLTNVKIFIVKLLDKPDQVDIIPTNTTVYCYFIIELTANDTDINYDNISLIKIKFKVKNDWLKNQNIDKNNINFVKYENNGWVTQNTKYFSEDNSYTYYETSMSTFSNLAIVGMKTTTGENTPAPVFNHIFIIIAVIVIIILIISILFKTGILYIEEETE